MLFSSSQRSGMFIHCRDRNIPAEYIQKMQRVKNEDIPLPMLRVGLPTAIKIVWTLIAIVVFSGYLAYYSFAASCLWFSSIALFVSCIALWRESALLTSMQTISVLLLEIAYTIDLIVRLLSGHFLFGLSYYFFQSEDSPFWVRSLSLFHIPLPALLLWMIHRLGYDPRALALQTAFAWSLLLMCYFFTDPRDNVNWVFGPQQSGSVRWLLLLLVGFPIAIYWPTHILLKRFFADPRRREEIAT